MARQQLMFQMSLTESVTIREAQAQCEAFAREEHERAETLAAECDRLRTALVAAQRKALEQERETAKYRALAEMWERRVGMFLSIQPQPSAVLSKDILTDLLCLAHPDRWSQGQPATVLAHELAVAITKLRA